MGRHSIPDPEGSSSGPPEGAGDATEQFDQPLVPPDDYRGDRPGPPEPDYPRYGEPDYDEPAYPRPRYTEPEYPNPNAPEYREPGYQEPEFETEYESDYSDDYESDYPESDYPASEYSDLPEYLQAGYREPNRRARISSTRRGTARIRRAHTRAEGATPRLAFRGLGGRRMDRQPPRDPNRPQGCQLGCDRRSRRSRRGGGGIHPVAVLR